MKGIIASAITLFSGVIFVTEEKAFTGFDVILLAIMFIFNCVFILTWLYLLLWSLNIKNENFQRFLKIFGLLVRKEYDMTTLPTIDVSKNQGMNLINLFDSHYDQN